MKNKRIFTINDGMVTFSAEGLRIVDLLDSHFLHWAASSNAECMLFPPLISVKDLNRFDYFQNFPHLGMVSSHIQTEYLASYAAGDTAEVIPNDHLVPSEYILPSAACYNVYLHLRNAVLEMPQYISTKVQCFRNEEYFEDLQRLRSFTMREIVCVGSIEIVQEHLAVYKQRIQDFAYRIGLPLELQIATDPFYDRQSSRALAQRLLPVKEEFVYSGSMAVASLNFHRNFFGERCNIRMPSDSYAFSGCVAFGIERWVKALVNQFGENVESISNALYL